MLIKIKTRCKTAGLIVSGYRDSNSGPPTPEAGALTGLRYIPIKKRCKDTNKFIIYNENGKKMIGRQAAAKSL